MNISITEYIPYGDALDANGQGEIFTLTLNAGTEQEQEYTFDSWWSDNVSGEEWAQDGNSVECPLSEEEQSALSDVLDHFRSQWDQLWDEKVAPGITQVREAMLPHSSEIE